MTFLLIVSCQIVRFLFLHSRHSLLHSVEICRTFAIGPYLSRSISTYFFEPKPICSA